MCEARGVTDLDGRRDGEREEERQAWREGDI